MIKNLLFDIDGTLLPMDNDEFTKVYFGHLCKKLAPHGYDGEKLVAAIWTGTKAMVMNDGTRTNYEAFWDKFAEVLGPSVKDDEPVFEEFYKNEFNKAKSVMHENPLIPEFVKYCKEKGYRMIVASNPLFPGFAQKSRMTWAGINPDDFDYITSYENSHFCKPNPLYFKEIADTLGLNPEECLVIGNDAIEDTASVKVGMNVFLVTDWLLNKENRDISVFPNGNWNELKEYIENL